MFVYFVPTFAITKVNGIKELMAFHVLKLTYKKMLVIVVLLWKCPNLRNKGLLYCLQYGYFSEFFSVKQLDLSVFLVNEVYFNFA